MSALQKARDAAQKAAANLRNAEEKAKQEAAQVKARNTARVEEFWSDAGARCQQAGQAATVARKAVIDAAAEGDMLAAIAAYPDYVRRKVEHQTIVGQAHAATATYVWTETRRKDPNAKTGKVNGSYVRPEVETVERRCRVQDWDGLMPPTGATVVHAKGVLGVDRSDPTPLVALIQEGIDRLAAAHGPEFYARYAAPLRDALEPAHD